MPWNASRMLQNLKRLERACENLPRITEQVEQEARAYVLIQADLSVYLTAAGAYTRTNQLREGLSVRSQAQQGAAQVTVTSDAPHARVVELGREGMTLAALQALAARQGGRNFALGRSGQQWEKAAPIVTGGQAYAAFRLRELFIKEWKAAAR